MAEAEEEKTYSLVEITKEILLRAGNWGAVNFKEGFFKFLKIALVQTFYLYKWARKTIAKYHKRLIDYIDGRDILKKRQAASFYLKNISVHKDEVKKSILLNS